MDWDGFLHADCDSIIFITPASHFSFLTFKCQSTAVIFASPLAGAVRIQWNKICPSFPPNICLSVFVEFGHYISLNFARVLETLMKLYMTTRFFLKNLFCPQNWGNGPKIGSLNLKKNLAINFHWICSIMNMFIVCCVPAQILYLGKILFLRCRPKYSQPIKLHNF